MKTNTFVLLSVSTVAVLALAVWAVKSNPSATAAPSSGGRLYADLRVNDVTALTITTGGETLRITRGADSGAWGLADRNDFPVEFERVKETLIGLSELDIIEPKTTNPARYGTLGVQGPDEPDSESTLVTLAAQGETLATLIVGNSRPGPSPALYVRKDGDERSYLCRGRLDLGIDTNSWVEQELFAFDTKRVERVTLTHPDGEVIEVFREDADEYSYALADIPEGREIVYSGAPNPVGTLLNSLRLDDFAPVGEVDFESSPGASAEYRTFDGLVVRIQATEREDDGTWVRFEVSLGEEPADDIAAQVDELNARFSPWAFKLPTYHWARPPT